MLFFSTLFLFLTIKQKKNLKEIFLIDLLSHLKRFLLIDLISQLILIIEYR